MAQSVKAARESGNAADRQRDIDYALAQAIALYTAGEYQQSKTVLDVILQAQPDNADALHHMGLIAHHYGQPEAAIDIIMQAIEKDPGNYRSHYNLGVIFELQDNSAQALECFETAVRLKSDCLEAQVSLGSALIRLGRYTDAIHLFNGLLKQYPDSIPVLNKAGLLFVSMGSPHIAVSFLRKAIELEPRNSAARLFLSDAYKTMGKLAESKEVIREALDINPDNIYAYCSLSEDEKFRRDDPVFALFERALERTDIAARIKRDLHFSLGKMYADTAEYDKSFDHYAAGNRLRREASAGFNRDEFTARIDAMIECFDRAFFSRAPRGLDIEKPIFIVGMPRSGTSLTEQILASHPLVYGGGELPYLSDFALRAFAHARPAQSLGALSPETVRDAARSYLSHIEAIGGDAAFVTDKMPANQMNVWAIALLFPHAKVIHCIRDAADNCLACYIKNFSKPHNYADDLADIAYFYRQSWRLMNHWKTHAPVPIYEMRYEDLVDDTEANIRSLLAFCGLPWDEACLSFHTTERVVHTASRVQVRKKIYSSSVGRWRKYGGRLDPMLDELGELAPPR
jgi:tetratricopeptide (TPR) repeat protein